MRILSRLVGAGLVVAGPALLTDPTLLSSAAHAADLTTTSAVPAYNWSGFYAGANAGGAWGYSEASTTAAFDPSATGYFRQASLAAIASAGDQDVTPTGFTAGGQGGYNRQFGWLVVGAEVDINYFGLKGASSGDAGYPCCAPNSFAINSSVSTDWLFTARPRAGVALNNWLIYITGGLAAGHVKGKFSFTDTFGATETGFISTTKTGWTFGGGIEVGVQGPWTVKVEYLLVDLGGASTTSTNLNVPMSGGPLPTKPFAHGVDMTASLVRAGLNYRF